MSGTEELSKGHGQQEPAARPVADGLGDQQAETGQSESGARAGSSRGNWSFWNSLFDDAPKYQSNL